MGGCWWVEIFGFRPANAQSERDLYSISPETGTKVKLELQDYLALWIQFKSHISLVPVLQLDVSISFWLYWNRSTWVVGPVSVRLQWMNNPNPKTIQSRRSITSPLCYDSDSCAAMHRDQLTTSGTYPPYQPELGDYEQNKRLSDWLTIYSILRVFQPARKSAHITWRLLPYCMATTIISCRKCRCMRKLVVKCYGAVRMPVGVFGNVPSDSGAGNVA